MRRLSFVIFILNEFITVATSVDNNSAEFKTKDLMFVHFDSANEDLDSYLHRFLLALDIYGFSSTAANCEKIKMGFILNSIGVRNFKILKYNADGGSARDISFERIVTFMDRTFKKKSNAVVERFNFSKLTRTDLE